MNAVLSNASIDPNELHAHQFHDWLMLQARLLREGKVGEADLVHIAQELEEMGNEIESALVFFPADAGAPLQNALFQPYRAQQSLAWRDFKFSFGN